MNDGEIISLQSHTIGSIGQIFKDMKVEGVCYNKQLALEEIERIYKGYITRLNELLNR
jgi:hypothetical protein